MAQAVLEERVAVIERKLAELKSQVEKLAQPKDWRSTIGMFSGDELMKRIDAAGQAIREKDGQQAKRRHVKKRRVKV